MKTKSSLKGDTSRRANLQLVVRRNRLGKKILRIVGRNGVSAGRFKARQG